jgi:hypothetical protein
METSELETELFYLIAFILTSASGLYDEPPDYASFRLVDVAGRLMTILQPAGWLDPFLAQLKEEIDAEREESMDPARQRERIEHWVLEIAHEMRRRVESA